MVKLNCASIAIGLMESELFGHEKGAYTGAASRRVGRLELAHQGTLFLDEIGELPLELQPKLLRALQEQEFEPVGGNRVIHVDIRLIAATNRNLEAMIADRQFRNDLYYRLNVFPIVLPPLRERREDIPLLVRHFTQMYARKMNRQIDSISLETMRMLTQGDWPGNIRELKNLIERAVILSNGPTLKIPLDSIQMAIEPLPETSDKIKQPLFVLDEDSSFVEREQILRALLEANGLISGPKGAAARLGVRPTILLSKMLRMGISLEDVHFPPIIVKNALSEDNLEAVEREHILHVMRETNGIIGGARGAAARLGIKRTTLIYRMARLGISSRAKPE
jgi:formate hydrogenlyase transcriptional activator